MINFINETILFGKTGIHVRYDNDKAVEWVSLYDIMKILKRREKSDIEQALKVCKTKQQFPIYSNGALFWFIGIPDIYSVLGKVRKENKLIAPVCDELISWTAKLPIGRNTNILGIKKESEKKPSPVKVTLKKIRDYVTKNNDKKTYSDKQDSQTSDTAYYVQEQDIKSVVDLAEINKTVHNFKFNGREYINITEIAGKYNKNPREWLLRAETKQICQSMIDDGKANSIDDLIIKKKGHTGATFLEKSLYVEFTRWLDPKIAVRSNEVMNTLDEIGFLSENKPLNKPVQVRPNPEPANQLDVINKAFNLPDNLIDALELAAKLYRKIEEDKPKVQYYDRMILQRESFKSTHIAMELDISTSALHRFLIEERIIHFNGRTYEVYPNYQALQCDHPYYWTNPKSGRTYVHSKAKRWTHAGREYIIELYQKKHPQNLILID